MAVRQTETMQPAAYPPPPPITSAEGIKPSAWWYGVAAAVAVAGIVIAIVVMVQAIAGLVDRVDDFQRVSLPGSGTITLDETGGYTVYHEFSGASDSSTLGSSVSVNITGPDGQPVELRNYDSNVTYNWDDHEGVALYSFHADQVGEYTISAEGQQGVVAVGRGFGIDSLVGGIFGALVIGLLGAAIGGAIAIVVGVKRGKSRRSRSIHGPQYGPGPPGSGWAASGWPQATQPVWTQPGPGGPSDAYPPTVPQQPQPQPPQPPPGGPYAPQQPPPGQYPPGGPGPMQPPPGLPPT
jgi:hypothetical protein